MHEVVVQNRLEQLRKRQRDEALLAQEELLRSGASSAANARNWGGDMHAEAVAVEKDDNAMEVEEKIEPYERGMSPALIIDISALHPDEREIEILDELEDRKQLVGCNSSSVHKRLICLTSPLVFPSSFCHLVTLRA